MSCPLPEHGKGNGDRNPSVSVDVGQDGKILIKCRAGCDTEDIVTAWGLRMSDLFKHRSHGHDFEVARKKFAPIPRKTTATVQPCNLSSYSEAKGLPKSS